MSEAELVRAVINARELKTAAETAVVVELQRRGWSYRQIGRALDINWTTARDWALRDPADTENHPNGTGDDEPQPAHGADDPTGGESAAPERRKS